MAVHRGRVGSWVGRVIALAVLAVSLTCGGDDGGGGTGSASLSGTAYWSGPVRGANVVVFQLVDGQRTLELARTTTGDDGGWSINHDGYEHVEVDVTGGSYTEPTGGEVTLDANTTLRGVALDLQINEQRAGVIVSPWTHLAVGLGRARWLSGSKESTYSAAVSKAIERLTNHLGFDPTKTAVAPVSASAGSPTEQVKYGLSLAGLSQLARLIAQDQGATVQSVNTVELTKILARDAGSAEALFDGNSSELLFVGASCPPPTGCSMEGPGCYASCAVHTNTLRSRLGSAVLAFLLTPENRTTLTRDDVAPWLEAVRANVDAELFGTEATEPFDSIGPTVTWVAPAAGATVAGTIAVEVTAADPVGVSSLTVTAETPSPMQLVDTDPAPERFAAQFSTIGIAEGALTLTATAADTEDNSTSAPRMINLNNVSGGTVSGVLYKGRVGAATVRVYQFMNGVRGTQVGSGSTASDGSFTNVMIADGYSGPLLVEAGFGGTYPEEAASATVTLDVNDRLRTVIPTYADGGALSGLMVTPLTSFATTYFEYLQQSSQGGSTIPDRWTTARSAIEAHFGVANIYTLTPLAPSEMTTFNAPARYGMIMVGLSETARRASTLGGGDGGTFGSAMNAMRVVRVLETDLADGCWDGRQGVTPLNYGGTQAVGDRAVRRGLAEAIVSYVSDGARNQTPYAGAADILGQLDTLSNGGGNASPGSCTGAGANRLNPDAGSTFDQSAPTVSFVGMTPPAGFVRGTITVDALATDNLDVRPTLKFTSPMMTADADGDETDSDAHHTWDTTTLSDGPLVVTLEAEDDAMLRSDPALSTRTFVVDNRAPMITFNILPNSWHRAPGPFVSYTVDETNVASVTDMLDGGPFANGQQVSAGGMHTLVVTVQDQAGAMTTASVTFYVDLASPTFAFGPISPSGTVIRGTLDVTAIADDNMKQFDSLGSDIAVTANRTGNIPVSPTATIPTVLGDMKRQLQARFDTAALPVTDGEITVTFDISDRAGNPAMSLSRTWIFDNNPPTINVNVGNQWYGTPQTVTFSQTDANAGTTTATLNGADFMSGTLVNAEGRKELIITARDLAGNERTQTVVFFVDLVAPMLSHVTSPAGTWVRGTLSSTVTADDGMKMYGSLATPISLTATGPAGSAVVPTTNVEMVLGDMRRQRMVVVDTTAITQAVGDGQITLTFGVTDQGMHANSLSIMKTIDNTPPTLTLSEFPFGTPGLTGWTRARGPNMVGDPVLVLNGTVTDVSPVSVSATVDAAACAVTLTGANWSCTPASDLAEGDHAINITATDAAGNTSTKGYTLKVDRTGPSTTARPSPFADERGCTVNLNFNQGTGAINGDPVYTCPAPSGDLLAGSPEIRKYTTRLASSADNPLRAKLQASDVGGGVGVDASSQAEFRVYRVGQPPPAWVPATFETFSGSALQVYADILSTNWPELLTHSADFQIDARALDKLGNVGAAASWTWKHRPLAPTVTLSYVGRAPQNTLDDTWSFSLYRNTLNPQSASYAGPAEAMTSGFFQFGQPRSIYEFKLWNPHPQPITVGFFIPGVSGATYTKNIWDTAPWISSTQGAMTAPNAGVCGWPTPSSFLARVNQSSQPYNCNTAGNCTCNGAGWTRTTDVESTSPPATSIGSGPMDHPFTILAWDAATAPDSLLGGSGSTYTDPSSGITYRYVELTVPARIPANPPSQPQPQAREVRVQVAISSLDLWNPSPDPTNIPVLESDGPGSEVLKRVGASQGTTMTAAFYEKIAEGYMCGVSCSTARVRRRYKALVEARLAVPAGAVNLRARSRAAASAIAEPIQGVDATLEAVDPFNWDTCENLGWSSGTCSPQVPTTSASGI